MVQIPVRISNITKEVGFLPTSFLLQIVTKKQLSPHKKLYISIGNILRGKGDKNMTMSISALNAGQMPMGTPGTIVQKKEEDTNWFSDWLDDKDKVCTDGADDGSISFGEAAESFGKGLMGLVKGVVNHPIATAVTVGAGALLTVATGGAALPVMVALGAGTGAVMIGKGAYDAATAETDAQAKAAWEGIGNGTFAVAASVLGAKSSLKAASKAGVTSAQGAENMNMAQATLRTFKTIPEALKVSGQNVKGNVLTWTTGNIHAHSNKLQGAEAYMSKANDVQAYRFNPNGTPEEILANNPGVFRGADGKYYLPNKWAPNEPYLIDPSKENMIMLYGGDDMAVCDGAIFKGSYVDTEGFHSSQALNYQDPSKLAYGEVVNVTKQAPGAFKVMPEGTKIQTLEGVRTVGEGEVVALDHAGNPYATTPANILKRNTGLSDNAMKTLYQLDPAAVEKNNMAWLKTNKPDRYSAIVAEKAAAEAAAAETAKTAELTQILENKFGIEIKAIYPGSSVQYDCSEMHFVHNGRNYMCARYGFGKNSIVLEKINEYNNIEELLQNSILK